jgi:hypothetical protein
MHHGSYIIIFNISLVIKEAKMFSIESLRKNPLFFSFSATGATVATIVGLYKGAQEVFKFQPPPLSLLHHAVYLTIILFLSILAYVYQSQEESGPLGKSFKYDKNGVLWHGTEKAIAFRVVTFLGILEQIAQNIPNSSIKEAFLTSGRIAGNDFGQQFGNQIYPAELRKDSVPFDQLSKPQRLALWSEYDSSTGWGLLSAYEKVASVDIVVKHPTLFKGSGGEHFSYLLAGYCETVVNAITNDIGGSYVFSGTIDTKGKTISFSLRQT